MKTTLFLLAALSFCLSTVVRADTTCVACAAIIGILEQDGGKGPDPSSANPDSLCQLATLCTNASGLWPNWPNVSSPTKCIGRGTPESPCTDGGAVDDTKTFPNGSTTVPFSAKSLVSSPALREADALISRMHSELGMDLRSVAGADVAPHAIATLLELKKEEAKIRARRGSFDFFEAMEMVYRGISMSLVQESMWVKQGEVGDWPCSLFNISCIAERVFDEHLPLADSDTDDFAGGDTWLFSDGFRGASWRGRDCNDTDRDIYPGRTAHSDATIDSNCNGIYGLDSSGNSYEQQWCSGDNAPMGISILGDSAAAHFSIPPELLNARLFPSLANLTHALNLVANEADWPQCSWSTGFRTGEGCLTSGQNMTSFYQLMLQRNRCIHRDFQNAGVNGARADSLANGISQSMARTPNDRPMIVFHAVIG